MRRGSVDATATAVRRRVVEVMAAGGQQQRQQAMRGCAEIVVAPNPNTAFEHTKAHNLQLGLAAARFCGTRCLIRGARLPAERPRNMRNAITPHDTVGLNYVHESLACERARASL